MPIETVNFWLGVGTIALQIASVALLALFLLRKRVPDLESNAAFIATWGIWLALIVATGALAMTLIHEQLFGLPACSLCWWQRIFMYPQVLIFGLALKKKLNVWPIVRWMSIIGGLIALVHYATQWQSNATSCIAGDPACLAKYVFQFGYITIPLMALTVFGIVLYLSFRRSAQRKIS